MTSFSLRNLSARNLGFLALAIFLLSRIAILLHAPVMTDANMYYELAKRANWGSIEVYKDFPFAYPFLSWLAIAWPPLLDAQLSFETYQKYLHLFFFALEFAVVAWIFLVTRAQDSRARLFARALIFYSAFSALQFNLIYDRVDLLMTLSLISIFVFWESYAGPALIIGFLTKLVPMGFWPFKFKELWSKNPKSALISTWIPVTAIAILYASTFIFPAELAALSNHASRGIQLESVWSTPFLILHILGFDPGGQVVYVFGAQEVHSDLINETVLGVAKYFGFAVLALVYLFVHADMKSLAARNRVFLIFILSFLCFQRVLSTQFFLWLTPFLALALALEFSWVILILTLVIFALTAYIFDPGYGDLIHYETPLVALLALRNCLLIILWSLWIWPRRIIASHHV